MRVVSLLPSATETVCLLPGAEAMLQGRSHECDWPPAIRHLPVLTASNIHATDSAEIDKQVKELMASGKPLYTVNEAMLQELQPDVIFTQDICKVCSIDLQTVQRIAKRMKPQPKVVSLNPLTLDDVLREILKVGDALGMAAEAQEVHDSLRGRIEAAKAKVASLNLTRRPEVAYMEWLNPIFVGGHWTPEIIELAGGRHSLNAPGKNSIERTPEEVIATNPDFVLLSPCGYEIPTTRKELPGLRWLPDLCAAAKGRAVVVNGNHMFNRPGPRLVDALEWLVGFLHDRPDWAP
eukprot:EG_transcript_21443